MADRYWVGGTGTWNGTNTANWAAASGGAGGESAPTSVDNVFFDAGSDVGSGFTVTVATGAVCRNLTINGLDQVMTFAGTQSGTVWGDVFVNPTNYNRTNTGTITFRSVGAARTIDLNGAALSSGPNTFNEVGTTWTLQSAATFGVLNLTNGDLDVSASNYTVTCLSNFSVTGGYFNGRAGQLILTATNTSLTPALSDLHDVAFTATGATSLTLASSFIECNNLTFTRRATAGAAYILFNATATVNILGTLDFGAPTTDTNRRYTISASLGQQVTINAAAVANLGYTDFYGIINPNATWTGTSMGDAGGNSGITFTAPKTVYMISGGTLASANIYAATSGGTPNLANFPLPQDTIIFDANTAAGSYTLSPNVFYGDIDATAFDKVNNIGCNGAFLVGDLLVSALQTLSGATAASFAGFGDQDFAKYGVQAVAWNITINKLSGTLRLLSDINGTGNITYSRGAVDLNGFEFIGATLSSATANARTVTSNGGNITLIGTNATVISIPTLTDFVTNGDLEIYLVGSPTTGTRTIAVGSTVGNETTDIRVFVQGGSAAAVVAVTTPMYAKLLDFTGFTGSLSSAVRSYYGSLTLDPGMTLAGTSTWTFANEVRDAVFTPNGQILDRTMTKSGAGKLILGSAWTQPSNRAFTYTAGGLDLNGYSMTIGSMGGSGTADRTLSFSGGSVIQLGNGDGPNYTGNFTINGPGEWVMAGTGIQGVTFAPITHPYTLVIANSSNFVSITGDMAVFDGIENTVSPAEIRLASSQTFSFYTVSLSGSSGNLVTLRASSVGTRTNLVKLGGGVVDTRYMNIQDTNVSPTNTTWYASLSTDSGNNVGWGYIGANTYAVFTLTGLVATTALGQVGAPESVLVTGVSSNGQLGAITLITNNNITVTGVQATSVVGTATVRAKANIPVTGEEGSAFVGSVLVAAASLVPVTGVQAEGQLNDIALITNNNITVDGYQIDTILNSITVLPKTRVFVDGNEITGFTGNLTVNGAANIYLEGLSSQIVLGRTTIWGDIDDSNNVVWTIIPT